jgi:hypothetical protein
LALSDPDEDVSNEALFEPELAETEFESTTMGAAELEALLALVLSTEAELLLNCCAELPDCCGKREDSG